MDLALNSHFFVLSVKTPSIMELLLSQRTEAEQEVPPQEHLLYA